MPFFHGPLEYLMSTMSDALLSSQCVRLLRSGDEKPMRHLDYWIGSLLVDVVPWMGQGEQAARGAKNYRTCEPSSQKIFNNYTSHHYPQINY